MLDRAERYNARRVHQSVESAVIARDRPRHVTPAIFLSDVQPMRNFGAFRNVGRDYDAARMPHGRTYGGTDCASRTGHEDDLSLQLCQYGLSLLAL